jgi:hypothetical protein
VTVGVHTSGGTPISALAGSMLLDASAHLGMTGTSRTALHILTSWLGWAAAAAYVPLAAAEVIRPRLRFDIRRWSTVFPLGMAALASLHLSRVLHPRVVGPGTRSVLAGPRGLGGRGSRFTQASPGRRRRRGPVWG